GRSGFWAIPTRVRAACRKLWFLLANYLNHTVWPMRSFLRQVFTSFAGKPGCRRRTRVRPLLFPPQTRWGVMRRCAPAVWVRHKSRWEYWKTRLNEYAGELAPIRQPALPCFFLSSWVCLPEHCARLVNLSKDFGSWRRHSPSRTATVNSAMKL